MLEKMAQNSYFYKTLQFGTIFDIIREKEGEL